MRQLLALTMMVFMLTAPVFAQEADLYSCPMHPHITSEEPGTCPICGMDLTAIKKQSTKKKTGGTTIDAATLQAMNVETTHAHKMLLGQEVRGYGKITQNLANRITLSARAAGWVKAMAVHAEGESVSEGDLLLTFYSPELLAAQKDYLSAVSMNNTPRKNATKQRLLALGMQEKAIGEMAGKGKAFLNVPFYAPKAGYVSAIYAHNGATVEEGAPLMVLDDNASLWVDVAVSASDMPFLEGEATARLITADTGNEAAAEVKTVHPTIDPQTRTGQARLVVKNIGGSLRPGQYADVIFSTNARQRLAVPAHALLHAKSGYKVIVAAGEGHFYPQPVKIGVRAGGMVEVISGIEEHTAIVTNGQFLIDADSNLKNAGAHMDAGMDKDSNTEGGSHAH